MAREDVAPLLLLHGGGADAGSWRPVVERLPSGWPVHALNLPGHGGEPGFAYDARIIQVTARHVADRLPDLGLVRPHVVGHSMGGAVALELAKVVPVAGVTALCPIGFWTPPRAWVTAALLRNAARLSAMTDPKTRSLLMAEAPARRLVLTAFSARPSLIHPSAAAAAASALSGSDIVAMTKYTWRYRFRGRVPVPVLLAWATRDRLVPLSDADRARRLLPQAAHALLPGSGHLVVEDDPDLTAALVRDHAHRLPPADFTDA
ncbi:alpha/beta fold hydrolase [Saccharothrix variisporea]|uniref:Pimeloyl-ACP methyl ester carboxylesterase n=1 Tax=Saccharothrix variisporea TaxID=543527 RepID=A0A495XQ28_9PSEU|nr:alpha/beta hydrolase [Saccharothrix variisporea]RKT74553.1 pimeloyl-ACP methyl ester carboxylesterase [Saccharothrix variisporea]